MSAVYKNSLIKLQVKMNLYLQKIKQSGHLRFLYEIICLQRLSIFKLEGKYGQLSIEGSRQKTWQNSHGKMYGYKHYY